MHGEKSCNLPTYSCIISDAEDYGPSKFQFYPSISSPDLEFQLQILRLGPNKFLKETLSTMFRQPKI